MNNTLSRFEQTVLTFIQGRYLLIVVAVLLAAAFALAIAGFKVENSIESWVDQSDQRYQDYRALVDEFGDDASIHVVFSRDELNSRRLPAYLELIEYMRAQDAVSMVFDPVELFLLDDSGESLDETRIAALQSSSQAGTGDYRHVLVSQDTRSLGTLFLLHQDAPDQHAALLEEVRRAFDGMGLDYDLAGTAYVSQTIAEALTLDITIVVSSLMTIAILVLLFYMRNVFVVASVFGGIVISVIFSLAFATLLGVKLNLLSLVMFPLIFCVGLTTAIHLFSRGQGQQWQFALAWPRVIRPASLAMLTTLLGSSAFLFAPQTVVRDMGKVVPFAVFMTFVMMMLFVPAAYRLLARKWSLSHLPASTHARVAPAHSRYIGLALIGLAAGSLLLLPKISTEPDAIFFFKSDSELVSGYQRIEDRLTGLLVVEMVVEATDGQPLSSLSHSHALHDFVARASQLEGLTTVVSSLKWMNSPAADLVPERFQRSFVNASDSKTRISFRFRNISTVPYAQSAAGLQALWAESQYAGLEMHLTGLVPLILEAQDALLKTQAMIFPAIVLIMTVILVLVVRSSTVLLFACLANFLPLLIVLGAMAVLGIALNSINLFVASVMLGVIVDDTIHLIHAWQTCGSIDEALAEVRPALWITSVTMMLAFLSLLSSSLTPINQFGLLSVIAIVSAYLCDVYLLPWLMRLQELRK